MVTARLSFTDRIAAAWLDAAAYADQRASECVDDETARVHFASRAMEYQQQAELVADMALDGQTA